MKTSLFRTVAHAFLHRIEHRHCSNRAIHIVKCNLIKNENVLEKYGKKEFKILKQLGFNFTESVQDDIPNNIGSDELSLDVEYHVGHVPNQYPSIAQKNISQFANNVLPNTSLKNWIIPHKTQQEIGVPVTSTIDYYPFPQTYPTQQKQTIKSSKKSVSKSWKLMTNKDAMKYNFEDSIDRNVPILTRKLHKNTEQTLLIYRDLHHNLSNMKKVQEIIDKYEPNKIILELSPDGASIGLKSFQKLRYRFFIMPLLKIRQKTTRKSNESSVGKRWMSFMRKFCVLPPSYSSIQAINIAIKEKIPIVCSDYSESYIVPFLAFAEAMDKYQSAFYEMMKFPIKKLEKLMIGILPTQFARMCAVRLQPHLYIVAGYRNDMMSLAINECTEHRLLFIAGEGHCYDIIDRLCGDVAITNPFKDVHDDRVIVRAMTTGHYAGHGLVETELCDKDVRDANKLLGDDVYLMLLPNKQYDTVHDILSETKTLSDI